MQTVKYSVNKGAEVNYNKEPLTVGYELPGNFPEKEGIQYTRPPYGTAIASRVTYDEFWLRQNTDAYDYTPPANPLIIQEIDVRATTANTILKFPNAFGTLDRFTDINGASAFNKTYIIDHYSGLGYYTPTLGDAAGYGGQNFANSCMLAFNETVLGFEDWRLPNINELLQLYQFGGHGAFNSRAYSFWHTGQQAWGSSSPTPTGGFTNRLFAHCNSQQAPVNRLSNGTNLRYCIVRNHYN